MTLRVMLRLLNLLVKWVTLLLKMLDSCPKKRRGRRQLPNPGVLPLLWTEYVVL